MVGGSSVQAERAFVSVVLDSGVLVSSPTVYTVIDDHGTYTAPSPSSDLAALYPQAS